MGRGPLWDASISSLALRHLFEKESGNKKVGKERSPPAAVFLQRAANAEQETREGRTRKRIGVQGRAKEKEQRGGHRLPGEIQTGGARVLFHPGPAQG